MLTFEGNLLLQDAFIGFGGNIERQQVKAVSKWYIYDMQDIIDVLEQSDDESFSDELIDIRP